MPRSRFSGGSEKPCAPRGHQAAVEKDLAAVELFQAGDDAQGGALAAAAGPKQREDFTRA